MNTSERCNANLDEERLDQIKELYLFRIISLDLSQSELQNIPENAFAPFHNLKYLFLRNCSTEYIDPNAFNHLQNLQYVSRIDYLITQNN